LKRELIGVDKPTSEEKQASTVRKIDLSEFKIHSAPETIKKTGTRLANNIENEKETGEINSPSKEIRIAEVSKFAFQILYWLTDNALLTKELCSFGSLLYNEKIAGDIKMIMQEVHTFSENAKNYFNQQIASIEDSDPAAISYDFVLPLFNKCFKSHNQLKEIQHQIIDYLGKELKEAKQALESPKKSQDPPREQEVSLL